MGKKIRGTIGVKRFYLPGFLHSESCPKCGKEIVWDGEDRYVSYPEIGGWENFTLWCQNCDTEVERKIRITAQVEVK